jgi:hypothetical protein
MIFLVLSVLVPARSGDWMPQYIPMPSMEECRRVAPLLVADVTKGFEVKFKVPGGLVQGWGESEPRRKYEEITRHAGVRYATADCREF